MVGNLKILDTWILEMKYLDIFFRSVLTNETFGGLNSSLGGSYKLLVL